MESNQGQEEKSDMKQITKEQIKQAKQDLEECDKNGEKVPVYFDQKKLQLYDIISYPNGHIEFITIPFESDENILDMMKNYALDLSKEYDVLHAIRCFEAISYALRGPNLDIVWIIEEYLKGLKRAENKEESEQVENWLNNIKDKEKVAKVRDILLHWEKYETRGPLIDQFVDDSDSIVVNEKGTIFDVMDASDEKYKNIRFGWYYVKPNKRVLVRWIEETSLHRASWRIR